MSEFIMIAAGIGLIALWFLGGKTESAPAPVPIMPSEPKQDGKPRWHKYEILLELQDCLLASGNDEKAVKEICERIAPLLLGHKHE